MKFEVVSKITLDPIKVGEKFNNKMIIHIYYHLNKDVLVIVDEDHKEHEIQGSNLIFLFYINDKIKQYDYVMKLDTFELIRITCNEPFNKDFVIRLGNFYTDPQLTMIYNKTKKFLYNKNKDIVIKEYNRKKFVFEIKENSIKTYFYHDFFSEEELKPLVEFTTEKPNIIRLIDGKEISSRLQNVDLSQYSNLSFYKNDPVTLNPLLVDIANIVDNMIYSQSKKFQVIDSELSSHDFLETSMVFKDYVEIIDIPNKVFATKYPIEKYIYGTDKIKEYK